MTKTAKVPTVLWAQRWDIVSVSIQITDVTNEKIDVDDKKLYFHGRSLDEDWEVTLEFNQGIIPEESKQRKGGREYYFELKKRDQGPYWPRLLKDTKKYQNIKVDFSRWKDEDEEDDDDGGKYDDASLEDMMQQMGTGGGNFDPGDAPESDSDDEDIPSLESAD